MSSAGMGAAADRCSRFANNQFWRNGTFFWVVLKALNALQQNPRGTLAHVVERLANRGQAGVVISGGAYVVEANYGNVFRDGKICVSKRANSSDGGNIVE